MENHERPDAEKVRREWLSHFFTTADQSRTGDPHRDEHIFRLYQAAEKSKAFTEVGNALEVFALATGYLWQNQHNPLEAIYGIKELFNEHKVLTPIQQRIVLTHLAEYAEGSQRTKYEDDKPKILSLDKAAQLLIDWRNEIPDPYTNTEPVDESNSLFALAETFSKTDLVRILNAFIELGLVDIKGQPGIKPTKDQFMKQAGLFFGVDLSNYHKTLNQAVDKLSREANVQIFLTMSEEMESFYNAALERKKQKRKKL